jgi:uncharacterized protein (DUF305 family)
MKIVQQLPSALKSSVLSVFTAAAVASVICTSALAQSPAAPAPADASKMAAPVAKSMMQPNDMTKSMEKMHEKMSGMSMSGDQDMDFAMMMKAHHEGAIDMAQAELDHGKNPMMRAEAKKIISAQKKEIAEFDQWMKKHPAMKMDSMTK